MTPHLTHYHAPAGTMWPFEVLRVQGPDGSLTSFPAHAHVGQPLTGPLRLLAAKGPSARRPPSRGRPCAYRLRLTTSRVPGAGMPHGSVYLTMAGALGEVGPFRLPGTPSPPAPPRRPSGGPLASSTPDPPLPRPPTPRFLEGSCEEFEVEGPDAGPLEEVELWHDAPLASRGWHCAHVEVVNLTTGAHGVFDCVHWVDRAPSPLPDLVGVGAHRPRVVAQAERHVPAPDLAKSMPTTMGMVTDSTPGGYEVTLYTGRRAGAGTSSKVYVELLGATGTSGRVDLRRASPRSFSAGSIDVAGLPDVPWLGPLTHCRVGTDGSGFFAPWFLT